MTFDDTFPKRLAQVRAEKGLSQGDLAAKTGIAPAQISRYETGKNAPRPEIIARLARALDVSMDWLSTGDIPFGDEAGPELKLRLPRYLHTLIGTAADKSEKTIVEEIIGRLDDSFAQDTNEAEFSDIFTKLERNFQAREDERSEQAATLYALVRQMGQRFQQLLVSVSNGDVLTKDFAKRLVLDAADAEMLEKILAASAQRYHADDNDNDAHDSDDDFQQIEPGLTRIMRPSKPLK
jgi:transcriptional regulator with XRE-family HTH domain